jgi:hypothetical protein
MGLEKYLYRFICTRSYKLSKIRTEENDHFQYNYDGSEVPFAISGFFTTLLIFLIFILITLGCTESWPHTQIGTDSTMSARIKY